MQPLAQIRTCRQVQFHTAKPISERRLTESKTTQIYIHTFPVRLRNSPTFNSTVLYTIPACLTLGRRSIYKDLVIMYRSNTQTIPK